MELESILDKLLFLAVSGEDPTYITHFLLTYRRFTTPRSVLLAMQKRMRMLDNPCGDPMFACFAQMRYVYRLKHALMFSHHNALGYVISSKSGFETFHMTLLFKGQWAL